MLMNSTEIQCDWRTSRGSNVIATEFRSTAPFVRLGKCRLANELTSAGLSFDCESVALPERAL
jgi:hypothetical protein